MSAASRFLYGSAPILLLSFAPPGVVRAADAPVEASVLEASGESVTLNKGSADGVVVGQIFDLYQESRVYVLPLTNADVPLVKSQQRVARVQVVKTEPSTCQARIIVHDAGPDGKAVALEPGSLRALHNPTAAAPNRRPTFLEAPELAPAPWRSAVAIELEVSNERDDAEVYRWSVTGGQLLYADTVKPSNVWIAPPRAGDYTLTVQVRDSAGNEARTALTLKATGIEGLPPDSRRPTAFKAARTFGATSGFTRVGDLAFDLGRAGTDAQGRHLDPQGRRFLLSPKQGWGGQAVVRVYSGESLHARLPAEGHEFTALASDGQALFLLDGDRRTILRYPFGGRSRKWSDLLKKDAIEFGVPDGGTGNARFQDPIDMVATPSGELYVLDAAQRCVQVFTSKDQRGVFLVSFGRAGSESLELQAPKALAVGRDGAVYVLDDGRKMVVVYQSWRPVAEFPVGTPEEALVGVAVDPLGSDVYVLTKAAVKRFARDGTPKGTFGEGEPGSLARIERPTRLRIDPSCTLWVIDHDGDAVARFDAEGRFVGRRGGFDLPGLLRVAAGPSGELAVLDRTSFKVTRFDADGWATARFGGEGTKPEQFEDPVDVAITMSGELLVLDAGKQSLLKFSPQGTFLRALGSSGADARELTQVRDLSMVNNRGYAAVLQQRPENSFNLLDPESGKSVRTFGKYGGETMPRLGCVLGVTGSLASDESGPQSNAPWFWTVDDDCERIHLQRRGRDPQGLKVEFDEVSDIEVSAADQVFVVDTGDEKVFVLDPAGELSVTLKDERCERPWDLGVDDFGRLYVYDRRNQRIVEFVPSN